MKQCARCGKEFTIHPKGQAKKYCSQKCNDIVQGEKRRLGLQEPRLKTTFVAKEFFDWREYPNTVII